ncbi:hypothetical protein AB4Y90_11380 [Chryseobacterium sp. 2TAF14]|uniref:hypothetical protein n=1 Tax=Chryseobacterium sp. 2TAF14 TaxID=3233007 RepID=UPI003F91FB93
MSLLHTQFTEWTVKFLGLPGGNFGMYSYMVLIFCLIITLIGLVTVVIFRKNYNSILKIAILFESIYWVFLIISGNNPFLYFTDQQNENLLVIMMYSNSIIVFLLMFLVYIIYSKIISPKK